MKKDYYTSWTKGEKLQKLAKALVMIENVTVPETATLTGVPQTVIKRAARDAGRAHFIKDEEKHHTVTDYYYDQMLPVIEEETTEQRVARIEEAKDKFSSSCYHNMFHVRCSRCMRILGSEQNYIKIDSVHQVVNETLFDCVDGEQDMHELTWLINDRLNKLTHEA